LRNPKLPWKLWKNQEVDGNVAVPIQERAGDSWGLNILNERAEPSGLPNPPVTSGFPACSIVPVSASAKFSLCALKRWPFGRDAAHFHVNLTQRYCFRISIVPLLSVKFISHWPLPMVPFSSSLDTEPETVNGNAERILPKEVRAETR
jgi:hypothetical protein